MTLFVSENKLPLYFKGASRIYYKELKEPHKNRGKPRKSLPRDARLFLQQKLSLEYELYSFVKQRLKKQQKEIKLKKLNSQAQAKKELKEKVKKINNPPQE